MPLKRTSERALSLPHPPCVSMMSEPSSSHYRTLTILSPESSTSKSPAHAMSVAHQPHQNVFFCVTLNVEITPSTGSASGLHSRRNKLSRCQRQLECARGFSRSSEITGSPTGERDRRPGPSYHQLRFIINNNKKISDDSVFTASTEGSHLPECACSFTGCSLKKFQ